MKNAFSQLIKLEKSTRQLAKWIKTGRYKSLTFKKRQQLTRRIERMQQHLSLFGNSKRVKRAFATAAVVLGLAINPMNAQNFGTPITNNPLGLSAFGLVNAPAFGDLDGDGDLDLIIAENVAYGCKYKYIPNIGTKTNPSFGIAQSNPFGLVPSNFDYLLAPVLVDIDDDGDLDVFSVSYYGIEYYENEGTATAPLFGSPNTSNPFGLNSTTYSYSVDFADIDGDGDLDAFLGDYDYGDIQYFENTGTASVPVFTNFQVNPFGLSSLASYSIIRMVDIDGDGDYDIVGTENSGGFVCFLNTGSTTTPIFGNSIAAPFGLTKIGGGFLSFPDFADLDDDGDMDILTGTNDYGPIFAYHKNSSVPISGTGRVTTTKNVPYDFQIADFPFTDADNADSLTSILITTIPMKGTLRVLGQPFVTANTTIIAADIPKLRYTPVPNEFGMGYTNFRFQVSDGVSFSSTQFMVINVAEFVSTGEILTTAELSIAPNPVSNLLNINLETVTSIKNGEISILDYTGKVLYSETLKNKVGNRIQQQIDVNHLPNGVYILKISTDNGQLVRRFVK
jgi:hypothetical protein